MKAADLVRDLKSHKNTKSKSHDYQIWPKCSHAGCPLQTTIKAENCTCTYHYREHGFSAECITESVKEHANYLKKHREMIYWNVREWKDKKNQLMGWPVLPATEQEMDLPTLYLTRLKTWINKSIKEKAEEFYKHGI